MKSNFSISEEQRMHITAIIASTPRKTLKEFKESISDLGTEELQYLKRELHMMVAKGNKNYLAALNSL